MRRYWISEPVTGTHLEIKGEVFHHIFDVCRQEKGNHFEVLNGDNRAHLVEVINVAKKSALVEIKETREIKPLAKPNIHLVLSVPRYPVLEAVLEKAVEMGVHTLHLAFSENSFVRSGLPENKWERWQKIVVSATQQSGRGELMQFLTAEPLKKILEKFNPNDRVMGLFAYEGDGDRSIRADLQSKKSADQDEVWIFVGAEGGFSSTEVQLFREKGMAPVTLGAQVLRVETACIALLAVLKYEFDLMR